MQISCRISLAVPTDVCSSFGARNSRKCKQAPSKGNQGGTYLKYKVHMMLLENAQYAVNVVSGFSYAIVQILI